MRAAVLNEARTPLTIDELTIDDPGPGEAIVRVVATGVCHSDLHFIEGTYPARMPTVLGHEVAGVVEAVGEGVVGFQLGDPVIAEGSWGCQICAACQGGREPLCPNRVSQGRTRDGTFAEFLVAPTRGLHMIPRDLDFGIAQALISVACSVRAMRRGRPEFGDSVAIFGPGIAGLILSQLAHDNGASGVTMFGTRDWRLDMAANLGADETINVRQDGWMERARSLTNDQGYYVLPRVPSGPQRLVFTYIGYAPLHETVEIVAGDLPDGPAEADLGLGGGIFYECPLAGRARAFLRRALFLIHN